jgi:hypothetical protein
MPHKADRMLRIPADPAQKEFLLKNPAKPGCMSAVLPEGDRVFGFSSMLIPTIAIIAEILVNSYIIWFLLISIPADCAHLMTESSGGQSCGIETGAYGIAGISAVLILIGIFYLAKWNFPRKE